MDEWMHEWPVGHSHQQAKRNCSHTDGESERKEQVEQNTTNVFYEDDYCVVLFLSFIITKLRKLKTELTTKSRISLFYLLLMF